MIRPLALATASLCTLALLPLAACGGKDTPATTQGAGDHDHDHDHAAGGTAPGAAAPSASGDGHSHGATTELGEQESGGFKIKASRDGDIKAGGDAPIDVWVTGGAKIASVRFWIGTEDAKGSMKAKAELETDNWHTHAEVPEPLPAGAKLWIEIEAEGGAKTVAGFDLKM
jgi:hypothetical protein